MKNIQKHAAELAIGIYPQVYDFVINNLAGVLSRCVECKVTPRESTDELTARSIVNQQVLGNPVIYEMSSKLIILKGYALERMNRKNSLPPISNEIINRLPGGKQCFEAITVFLAALKRDYAESLLDRAAAEVWWDHNFTELVLGRCVWDWMYQPAKKCLPPDLYGAVWFE
jgi:hypothetical protein